ncbi:hypothetical protein, partial [uncultured Prevotella sp.]|uniref:hypothetical protein n=1 Tax=uncultured Prevotella sp. TaxID=159272 RepID=UPI0025D61E41
CLQTSEGWRFSGSNRLSKRMNNERFPNSQAAHDRQRVDANNASAFFMPQQHQLLGDTPRPQYLLFFCRERKEVKENTTLQTSL